MSFVMTARSNSGQNVRHRCSTRAVLPEPTGPPTPSVNALRLGPAYGPGDPGAGPWSWWRRTKRSRPGSRPEKSGVKPALGMAVLLVGRAEAPGGFQLARRQVRGQRAQLPVESG